LLGTYAAIDLPTDAELGGNLGDAKTISNGA
jgi:hypothetical protein